ncbi:MAG: hypothetical protein AB1861_10185 [Cyanobacteriota bacterium]
MLSLGDSDRTFSLQQRSQQSQSDFIGVNSHLAQTFCQSLGTLPFLF